MDSYRDDFWRFEHVGWEKAANQYEACWSSLTRKFIPSLLQAVGVNGGTELLDVACGPGYVSEIANQMGAAPVGIDFCSEMICQAKERNPGIAFHESDAQQLAFGSDSFDAVVTNFGVPHLSAPAAAFAEAYRVLRTGGRFAFTVWAKPELNPGVSLVEEAIEKYADTDVDLPEGPAYFAFCESERCRQVLSGIGFEPSSLVFETVRVDWQVPTAAFFFESERDGGVRTAALLAHQTPEKLATIQAHIENAVQRYRNGKGYAIPMTAHVVSARADK